MRTIIIFIGALLMTSSLHATHQSMTESPKNVYGFSFETLVGHQPLPLSSFKGKVILIVNTASKCGFTPQYEALEKLYQAYKDKGFVVVGVPSNDFGHQEPGSSEDIAHFCKLNYGVTFPMTTKQTVVGDGAHPFYRYARQQLGFGSAPKWNFHKYLINREGKLVTYFYSMTSPNSKRLVNAVERALNSKQDATS